MMSPDSACPLTRVRVLLDMNWAMIVDMRAQAVLTAMHLTLTAGFAAVPSLALRELEADLVAVVVRDVVGSPLLRAFVLHRWRFCLLGSGVVLCVLVPRAVPVLGLSSATLWISVHGELQRCQRPLARAALASSETCPLHSCSTCCFLLGPRRCALV